MLVAAIATSVEYGIAFYLGYLAVRAALPATSTFARGLTLALLCLGVKGSVLRAPVMQLVIGNPIEVTAVQYLADAAPYVRGCLVVAYLYDWMRPHSATHGSGSGGEAGEYTMSEDGLVPLSALTSRMCG